MNTDSIVDNIIEDKINRCPVVMAFNGCRSEGSVICNRATCLILRCYNNATSISNERKQFFIKMDLPSRVEVERHKLLEERRKRVEDLRLLKKLSSYDVIGTDSVEIPIPGLKNHQISNTVNIITKALFDCAGNLPQMTRALVSHEVIDYLSTNGLMLDGSIATSWKRNGDGITSEQICEIIDEVTTIIQTRFKIQHEVFNCLLKIVMPILVDNNIVSDS